MPVGYKNSTDGNVQVAVNAFLSARRAHSFLGIDQDGQSCVVRTTGNPDGMIILRGSSTGPNYDAATVARTEQAMTAAGLLPAIMIDCSHANAGSDHTRQPHVWREALLEHIASSNAVIGMMAESNLYEGKQPIPADRSQLRYGVSVTDACVGWEQPSPCWSRRMRRWGLKAGRLQVEGGKVPAWQLLIHPYDTPTTLQ